MDPETPGQLMFQAGLGLFEASRDRMEDGQLLYGFKHRWRDSITHIVFEPLELVERLAALVPPPRFHLVRYHEVLAPAASVRNRIVPDSSPREMEARTQLCPHCQTGGRRSGFSCTINLLRDEEPSQSLRPSRHFRRQELALTTTRGGKDWLTKK